MACIALVGLPLLIAELSLRRGAQGDAVSAFENANDRGYWRNFGWICIFSATLILSYYAVIAVWALKYLITAATGTLWTTAGTGFGMFFRTLISDNGRPIF